MKKINWIRDYLCFNRTELRGIFILLTLLVIMILINAYYPQEIRQKPIDFSSFENEVLRFEMVWENGRKKENADRTKRLHHRNRGYQPSHQDCTKTIKKSPNLIFTIELNTADTFDLQRLKGIGPSFARRILSHRERLGGFLRKDQLLEVWGMDSARYVLIEKYIKVEGDSIKTINLNQVTFKELLRHPYFPFELTKCIIQYRQKNKKFSALEELKKIPLVNDSVFRRITPYLRIDP